MNTVVYCLPSGFQGTIAVIRQTLRLADSDY